VSAYDHLSFWHETTPDGWHRRAPLPGTTQVDVAIVGGGFTGLWTAHYLAAADPSLRIAVLEAETAGFGASGRNGGWCSALFPSSAEKLAALPGSSPEAARAQLKAMRESVDEVGAVAASAGIEADFAKGGTVVVARDRPQLERAKQEVEHDRLWGGDNELLDTEAARRRLNGRDVIGASYSPDCAAIHPARLVRGLADLVESQGVTIYEGTRVIAITPRAVTTEAGVVRADVVVRATEGYTPSLRGERRTVAPVYSLVVATEPLSDDLWDDIGLAERETFSDHRNLIVYGQRTADGRLVFGGRGAPYHFASRIQPGYDADEATFGRLRHTLVDLLPQLRGVGFSHAWGGPLGVPRDWCASVGLDRENGLAWAGGYVGDGVSTTNLAGRTLRDLILGHDTELTRLPWVNHRSPRWEPEPLRWLGTNVGLRAMTMSDVEERWSGKQSRIARWMGPLLGGH
jgi:glycine/D-amino acid oxidase-like deaminating enzyme